MNIREPALHGIAIYNPDLLSKEELVRQFVARRPLLDKLCDDLRRKGSNQHYVIFGQRGMGKTTLLRRLKYAVEDDPKLAARWIALSFPEEQYNISKLSDFYLNCVDALGDAFDRMGLGAEAKALDARVVALHDQDENERRKGALELLLATAAKQKRQLLLLIDNVDLIFDRLTEQEAWAFREVLAHEKGLRFIGASAAMLESTYNYGKPFYDFFRIEEMRGLDFDETCEVLRHLADIGKNPEVKRVVDEDPARIRTFHELAGGNPRTVVLLYDVLCHGVEGDVRADLEKTLDRCTPLYKARFEELPAQSQKVVDALAIHWDPISAGELAAKMRLDVNIVSAQLTRLEKDRIVEKVQYEPETKTGFQIAERFFNIWYLMRASRRVRQRLIWLVEFMRMLYSGDELRKLADKHLRAGECGSGDARERRAEWGLALAHVMEDLSLRRALESRSVQDLVGDRSLREKLSQFFDFEGEDAPQKPVVDRIRMAAEIRETILNAKVDLPGWDAERVAFLFGGLAGETVAEKLQVAQALGAISPENLRTGLHEMERNYEKLCKCYGSRDSVRRLSLAVSEGHMTDFTDIEGARAAAYLYGTHDLPALALASKVGNRLDNSEIPSDDLDVLRDAAAAVKVAYPWFVIGYLYEKMERPHEAMAAYEMALEIEPQYARAWERFCILLLGSNGSLAESVRAFRQWTLVEPDNEWGWAGLSIVLWGLHDRPSDESELAIERAVELNLGRPRWSYMLCQTLAAREKWNEALAVGKKLLANPQVFDHQTLPEEVQQLLLYIGRCGYASQISIILEETGTAERLRPLYEALKCYAAGSRRSLRRVAPEVRRPAERILDELYQGQEPAPPVPAPAPAKKTRKRKA